MSATMMNVSNGVLYQFEATCEKDEAVFVAVVFEDENENTIEFQTDTPANIEEFFYQVGKAKAEYERLTGKKLP